MSICDKDCLHCPYPDCINDEMDYDDYLASARLERDIIKPVPEKQCKKAAYQRAYYQANRDRIRAQQRAYRQANRDRILAQERAWYQTHREEICADRSAHYQANRDRIRAQQRAYYRACKGKHADQQKIETMRRAAGYTQKQFGALLGVTGSTISLWERGIVRADWDKLRKAFPEASE